jgi:predicted P-loop ATPase
MGKYAQTYNRLLRSNIIFAYDEFSGRMTIDGEPIGKLRHQCINASAGLLDPPLKTVEEAAFMLCWNNKINPVKDYLCSLQWDGVKRIDAWLIDHCGAQDTLLNRAISRKFMIDFRHALAEAVVVFGKGEDAILPETLWEEAAAMQQKRRIHDDWEDLLASVLEYPPKSNSGAHKSIEEIVWKGRKVLFVSSTVLTIQVLGLAAKDMRGQTSHRLAAVMRRLGWKDVQKWGRAEDMSARFPASQRSWMSGRTMATTPPRRRELMMMDQRRARRDRTPCTEAERRR